MEDGAAKLCSSALYRTGDRNMSDTAPNTHWGLFLPWACLRLNTQQCFPQVKICLQKCLQCRSLILNQAKVFKPYW